ncbi:MAG: hypothetical protein HOQ28_16915 [Thermoleophilia bacterium]|nr:hypothetical protein [Thermoleophilia bacterium]
MRRVVTVTLLLGLLGTSAVVSSAGATQPRLTRCAAETLYEGGRGRAVFTGSCNGSATTLNITPGTVVGHVGGLYTKLHGDGVTFTGRIGTSNVSVTMSGGGITGRYGGRATRFSILGTLSGRIGRARVACSISLLNPLGEQIGCKAPRGGAEMMIPLLALMYAAP